MKIIRATFGVATLAAVGLLVSCGGPDVAADEHAANSTSETTNESSPVPSAAPTQPAIELDFLALQDREDPERLLRYYAAAVRAGEWEAAAKAWSSDAGVTATSLRQQYGEGEPPEILVGKGDTEGAAGTVFYEAPIVVSFPSKAQPERRGTIVVRRANDVPGASEEQLNWRIERSTVLEPE